MPYVPFGDLTDTQKAQAIALRPKWAHAQFHRFQFWVCPDGALSRRSGHHNLTVEEGAKIDAMIQADIRNMDDTIESLRNQRNLLADALGRLLVSIGMTRADAPMTGPELLLAAETAIDCAKQSA